MLKKIILIIIAIIGFICADIKIEENKKECDKFIKRRLGELKDVDSKSR